jgi:SAM-dependent methyltransferase
MVFSRLILKYGTRINRAVSGMASGKAINLAGDRDIEWSWVASQIPLGPGKALDFGAGNGCLGLIAAQRGFKVTAVDIEPVIWHYIHPELEFIQGDILNVMLSANYYDLVINCSTVEHIGLVGRYGVTEDNPEGDLQAMARLSASMKMGGIMLLTIPVGQDAVFSPMCRVYGVERLPLLLDGFNIQKEAFWAKDNSNRWLLTEKETALNFEALAGSWNPLNNIYALGCFVLEKRS